MTDPPPSAESGRGGRLSASREQGSGGPADRSPSSRSRLALATVMTGAGILHFAVPGPYEQIVPRWLGHEQQVVRWSGVAEVLCGALLVFPRTKRAGAWLTATTLVAVYPANIQMAVDVGVPGTVSDWVTWLRLPLQLPLIRWAYRHAR